MSWYLAYYLHQLHCWRNQCFNASSSNGKSVNLKKVVWTRAPLKLTHWFAKCPKFFVRFWCVFEGFPKGEKITNTGHLNQFTACASSPLPFNLYCKEHIDDRSGEFIERLDTGMMTRSKRRSLGLELDELTSKEGCRKEDAITMRTTRCKTAGMLYTYR